MDAVVSYIDNFDWSTAPLADITAPLSAGAVYVAVVLALHFWMKRRGRGFDTTYVQAAHNLVLCVGSLAMALGTLLEVYRRASSDAEGTRWLFCERASTAPTGALWFWSYVYYLSKYYELLDTVLQLFKGRPPPHFFLHVYHHAVVLLMAWNWLEYVQTLQHIALLFNTSVHVVMYYYYFRRVLGWPVWWKRYVTQFQLVQFGSSAACGVVTLYLVAVRGDACAGKGALLFNFAFNMTLMYQFFGVLGPKPKAKSK